MKRETGENPVRSRHCKQGAHGIDVTDESLGRQPWTVICEPGNLPSAGTGSISSESRVIDCTGAAVL